MNKPFLYTGIISLLLVTLFIWTCPKEADFNRYLEEKQGIICGKQSFTCVQTKDGKEHKLELLDTKIHNGVFFMTVTKTFQTEEKAEMSIHSIGFLHMFVKTSITTL
ncbi:hypothetical protein ACFDTO_37020 [Microbacteriaceae bacterium 4G12]